MRNKIYWLLLICIISNFLTAQNLFVKSQLNSPGNKTVKQDIQFADIDNDGDQDLVGSDWAERGMLIYLNNSGVVDSVPSIVNGLAGTYVLTDWNNDSQIDVLILNQNRDSVKISVNQGAINFSSPQLLFTQPYQNEIKLKDLNGDGFIDVFSSNGNGNVLIKVNNAGAQSVTSYSAVIPKETTFGDFSDFNNDGLLDYVCGNTSNSPIANDSYVYFYRALSLNTFVLEDSVHIPGNTSGFTELKCANLNNIGVDEVIISIGWLSYYCSQNSAFDFSISLIGDSYFQDQTTVVATSPSPISVINDLDNNGHLDVVINNSVFFNSNFTFTEVAIQSTPDYSSTKFTLADTDGDLKKELWWHHGKLFSEYGVAKIYRITCTAAQTLANKQTKWEMFPLIKNEAASAFDFDNDGDIDFIYTSTKSLVYSQNISGLFAEKSVLSGYYYQTFSIDLNNDALTDLVALNYSGQMIWLKNNGSGNFQNMGSVYTIGTSYYRILGNEDIDNDGKKDFIVIRAAGASLHIDYLKNNGNGTLTFVTFVQPTPASVALYSFYDDANVHFWDFDADGFKDLIITIQQNSSGSDKVIVYKNNGATSFTQQYISSIGSTGMCGGVGDVNLDGKMDIIYVGDYPGFSNQEIKAIPNVNGFTFGTPVSLGATSSATSLFLTDIDGDGNNDPIVIENYQLAAGLNSGTGSASIALQGSQNTYYQHQQNVFFDYDMDGDEDILFAGTDKIFELWENTSIGPNHIYGKVFFDNNSNGIKDGNDANIPNFQVGIASLQNYATTNSQGDFHFPVGNSIGNLQVESFSSFNSNFTFTTPYPTTSILSNTNPIDSVTIGVHPINNIQNNIDIGLSGNRCDEGARLWLNYSSIAPLKVNGQLTVKLGNTVGFLQSSVVPSSVNSSTYNWNIDSIIPLNNSQIMLDINMPNYLSMGDTLNFYASFKTWMGTDTLINYDTISTILTCSYDPNEKQLVLTNNLVQGDHLYAVTDRIEYIIHFQNTGNDTAYNINVKDYLSPEFDYSSLEFISSSHPCITSINSSGAINFAFNNIFLPDSGASYLNSMGYVKFTVNLKTTAAHNTPVFNGARIYFDNNPPVYTNVSEFYRLNCDKFNDVNRLTTYLCSNMDLKYRVNSFQVVQNYNWQLDGIGINQNNDTAIYFIPTTGTHSLYLQVVNRACLVDTTININIGNFNVAMDLQLNIDEDTMVCPLGGTQILSSSFFTNLNWYINGVFNSQGQNLFLTNSAFIKVESPGTYCRETKEFNVVFIPLPPIPELINHPGVNVENYFCSGETINLTSITNVSNWEFYDSGTDSYTDYTNVGNSLSVTPDLSSNYVEFYVTSNVNGCISENTFTFYAITASPIISLSLIDPQDTIVCSNDSIGLNYSYDFESDSIRTFNNGVYLNTYIGDGNDIQFNAYQPGLYQTINYAGCFEDTTNSVMIYGPIAPIATLIGDSLFCSNNIDGVWWFIDDFRPQYEYYGAGYIIMDNNFAADHPSFYYVESQCGLMSDTIYFSPVGIKEQSAGKDYYYFTNGSNEVHFNSEGLKEIKNISIINLNGQVVKQFVPQNKISLDELNEGLYLIRSETNKGTFNKKIVITH